MTCKVTGYTDFTAQQSVVGHPSGEATLTHDIKGIGDCGGAVHMGQELWNHIQQDIKDSVLRRPKPSNAYIFEYRRFAPHNDYLSIEPRRNDYISEFMVLEVYPPHFRTGLEVCIKCILGELFETDRIKATTDELFNMAAREK